MSELSDYKRHISDPLETKLRGNLRISHERIAKLEDALRVALSPALPKPPFMLLAQPRRDDVPVWVEVRELFEKFGAAVPSVLLRDEIVAMLLWARYGEAVQAALAALPPSGAGGEVYSSAVAGSKRTLQAAPTSTPMKTGKEG